MTIIQLVATAANISILTYLTLRNRKLENKNELLRAIVRSYELDDMDKRAAKVFNRQDIRYWSPEVIRARLGKGPFAK